MNKISVIMPCWIIDEDIQQMTRQAIDSLGDVNLTVIDNASPLGGGYLRSVATTYIRNSQNLGFAKAMNQGMKLANTKFVALASNDTRPSPNWQEVALQTFDENPKAGTVHLRMTNYDVPFEYGNTTLPQGKERWCTAAFFVVRKTGNGFPLFDENFFNSYEDWDYFMRMREAGFQTVYTDKACYQHRHSATQLKVPKREEFTQANREYFKSKWGAEAESIFNKKYSDQVAQDYWKGFEL